MKLLFFLFLLFPDKSIWRPAVPLTILRVLSFLYQTLSEGNQGRISGSEQHVAVPRSEESLQKGKACFTFLAR